MKRSRGQAKALRIWGLGALLCAAAACNSVIGADEPELVDSLGSGGVGGSGVDASAGAAGTTGGTSGTAGKGGSAGTAGTAGAAGTGATGGAAGSAGSGGVSGAAGTGGAAGTAGTGGAPECNPTDKDCDGLTPRECSDGKWAPSGPACDYACADGACYGECVKDSTECAGKKFRTCGSDYMWQEMDCPLVCDSTKGCVGSCLPDTYQCNGATVLEKCSAQGQFQTDQVCAHECAVVGGVAKCVDCANGDSMCPTGCTYATDTDCPKGNGVTCGGNSECASGFCVDGVCCNTSCTGACMQCNLAGGVGTCSTISFTSDPDNCGACGASCSGNHITRSCVGGQCVGSCTGNYRDCNSDKRTDGCEIDVTSNVSHCGSCNASCSGNHISRVCTAGQCVGTCDNGYQDCDMDKRGDGCEINTNTNPNHCSTCGQVCEYGVCQSATCAFTKWGAAGNPPGYDTFNGNMLLALKITVANPGTLAALGLHTDVQNGDPTTHVRIGLYRDSSGIPNNLVAQTGSLTVVDGVTEAAVTPAAISGGDYWMVFVADNTLRLGVTSTNRTWFYATFSFGALPSTAPGMTSATFSLGHAYAVTVPN